MWSARPRMKPLLHGTFGSGEVQITYYGDCIILLLCSQRSIEGGTLLGMILCWYFLKLFECFSFLSNCFLCFLL